MNSCRFRQALIFLAVLSHSSCSEGTSYGQFRKNLVVSLSLFPQAYEGGGFSFPDTEVARTVPCRAIGLSRLTMIVDRQANAEPLVYDLTSLLNTDCQGSVIVPQEENLLFRIEGYDEGSALVREGFEELSLTEGSNELTFILWKARRYSFAAMPLGVEATDVVFTKEGVRLLLHFLSPVTPPSREPIRTKGLGEWALILKNEDSLCCSLAFADPREDGFPLQSFFGTRSLRVPFRFIGRSLHILLTPSLFPGGKIPAEARFIRIDDDLGRNLSETSGWISLIP